MLPKEEKDDEIKLACSKFCIPNKKKKKLK